MNILITGCAGFIGSHLCERLITDGHTVIGIDNFDPFYDRSIKEDNLKELLISERFHFHEIDIRVKKEWSRLNHSIDIVVHLAAKAGVRPSIEDPTGYINTNINGTQNLLDVMLQKGIKKIVFASSSSVYGNNTLPPFSEESITDFPISPYAFTKKACELMLYNYHHLYEINCVALRFFTVFGPRQRPDLAIHKFFNAMMNELPISIFGDGGTLRDYTFIEDIINGLVKAIEYVDREMPIFEIFNLGNNTPVKLLDLIQYLEKVTNKKAILAFKEMQPGDVDITCADITKSKRLLNYEPNTPILKGLNAFSEWKRTFGSCPV